MKKPSQARAEAISAGQKPQLQRPRDRAITIERLEGLFEATDSLRSEVDETLTLLSLLSAEVCNAWMEKTERQSFGEIALRSICERHAEKLFTQSLHVFNLADALQVDSRFGGL